MFNQASLINRVALSVASQTNATTATYVDMAPTASVGKRACKIIVIANGVTGTTPVFPLSLAECDTTNGTYSAVTGLTIANVTTNGVTEYHALIQKRYVQATIGTVTGTTPNANLVMLVQNQTRSA